MSASPALAHTELRSFDAPYAGADEDFAARFLKFRTGDSASETRIDAHATILIEAIRAQIRT